MKREPKLIYLKKLGESDYLPDKLYVELQEFKNKFGKVGKSHKKDIVLEK